VQGAGAASGHLSLHHHADAIDTITLTVPNARPYVGVARLFVGGLAARLDLAYEQADDLQLAVETVLLECRPIGETVGIEATIGQAALAVSVGPLGRVVGGSEPPATGAVDFATLLAALVDETSIVERDDELWLRLEKAIPSGSR
jgi:hypothetical protein